MHPRNDHTHHIASTTPCQFSSMHGLKNCLPHSQLISISTSKRSIRSDRGQCNHLSSIRNMCIEVWRWILSIVKMPLISISTSIKLVRITTMETVVIPSIPILAIIIIWARSEIFPIHSTLPINALHSILHQTHQNPD
jgi:hypothetical protein